MKSFTLVFMVAILLLGCGEDDPSTRDLLVGPLWVLVDVDNDLSGDYDEVDYMEVEFNSNGSYDVDISILGDSESGSGDWQLNGNTLILNGTVDIPKSGGTDGIQIESISRSSLVLLMEDDLVLTFEAD